MVAGRLPVTVAPCPFRTTRRPTMPMRSPNMAGATLAPDWAPASGAWAKASGGVASGFGLGFGFGFGLGFGLTAGGAGQPGGSGLQPGGWQHRPPRATAAFAGGV